MQTILDRRDSLVVLPTGGGKSLCFQAPALIGDCLAIVVSPLIALMKDQVDGLVADGVPAACFHSALTPDERARVLAGLRSHRYRLLYVSPERLVGDGGEAFCRLLGEHAVGFIAVDEAHCISQWGHDFRPEYRELGRLNAVFPRVSVHAFTATATPRVRQDIISALRLDDPRILVGSFDRPNLIYRVLVRGALKRQLQDIIARHPGEAGIIYCISRREVEATAEWLQELGHRALPYHAGLVDEDRHRNQDAFLNEQADIVVATVAFGMGIDRSNIRYVIHAGAPRSLEHYQQEAGRAGRDGLEAECVLVYSAADFVKWRRMLEASGELSESAAQHLRDMNRYAAATACRHRALVQYFGEPYSRASTGCGACDWCLEELDRIDEATVVAQKVLSAVVRVGQRWGIGHVTDVLVGRATPQVIGRHHHQLSTFGLLKGHAVAEVRAYLEQLTAQEYLQRTGDEYPVVSLAPRGVALLKNRSGSEDVVLYRQRRPALVRDRRLPVSHPGQDSWEGVDRDLFERLRQLRLQIARDRGVPPYVIFHDSTLREMARRRPGSLNELRLVRGVGARKAEDLGPAFLAVLACDSALTHTGDPTGR